MSTLVVDGIVIGETDNMKVSVPVQASVLTWVAIIGNLQLALRHPGNAGASSNSVRHFAKALLLKLCNEGLITEEAAQAAFKDFYAPGGSSREQ